MYRLLVRPPAHRGPRMVARPPTERLTPWLNPVGTVHNKGHWFLKMYIFFIFTFPFCLIALQSPTLRFLRRDFGEERHLGHSHEGEPQQLQEHPDDEGHQLPPVATWQVRRDGRHQKKGASITYKACKPQSNAFFRMEWRNKRAMWIYCLILCGILYFFSVFFEDPPTNGLAAVEAARETTAKLAATSFLFSAARHHAHLCENLCPPSGKKNKKLLDGACRTGSE